MNRLVLAAVLIVLTVTPAIAGQLIFDTGTPPSGNGGVEDYISNYGHIAFPVVFDDSDYRIEQVSCSLAGRPLFTLNVLEAYHPLYHLGRGTLVSTGSFKRPDSWDWGQAWCPVDVTDFTMKKGTTYWFEYTSSNWAIGQDWLTTGLVVSPYKYVWYDGSLWQWAEEVNAKNYAPGFRLYGYAVPEPSCVVAMASGLVGLIARRRSRSK